MKSTAAKTLIIIAALLSTAQTAPNPEIGAIQVGTESFPVRIEYKVAEALIGSSFNLDVVFTGANVDGLAIDSFDVDDPHPDTVNRPVTISREETTNVSLPETPSIHRQTNHCRVRVADDAKNQPYRIKMTVKYPGEPVSAKYFDLPIGARSFEQGRVTVEKLQTLPLVFKTGAEKQFSLSLKNESDYTITVTEVSLSSEPPGLLSPQVLQPPEPMTKSQTRDVPASFVLKSPDLIDLIKGFSEEPNLVVKVTYQDDYGRTVTGLKQSIPIKIIPNSSILITSIVIGVLFGTFVRFYIEYIAINRKLKRGERLKFVLYTTVFGLIVAAIALAGQFEIKALDHTMGSYDKPLVMFIIGLIGAIGGIQFIVAWYKIIRPKEGKPDA
ncbi:MAG: hypothetical protein QOG23_2460 [Blastocatellia bacterium]|jgi:hypothetical protein|nr:hypothetical protein [Blastocatellia bacterium]